MSSSRQSYNVIYRQSLADPDSFWSEQAAAIDWFRSWDDVLKIDCNGAAKWFSGGYLNACHNCVDRHVDAGFGEDVALIFESPVTSTSREVTFAELRELTGRLGGALQKHGIAKGDRVLIYMPNSPEAIIAMLACARIGAIHSVVFGGFAAPELASRIDDATPRLIIAASCGIEGEKIIPYQPIVDSALKHAKHRPGAVLYWQRDQCLAQLAAQGEYDWAKEMDAAPHVPCVPVLATDPLYILYTSGTTGQPKGVVRDLGGHLVTLQWSMNAIYDCPAGKVFWAASDVGWVVGHSYICYGPLLNRNPTVIFEGKPVGTPDAGIFWRIIAKHKVRVLFTAPTALRAIRKMDHESELAKGNDLSSLAAIFLAGERTDPDTLEWTESLLNVPVIDHWWQTETGSAIVANPLGLERLPIKAGSATVPMPGWDIACLDREGGVQPAGKPGSLAARLPLPPGFTPTLWNAPDRYHDAYFAQYPGWYLTGDSGFIEADGYVHVAGRIDDVINVAGHRLSSSAIEEVIATHNAVAECAVVGAANALKGQIPIGFVVLKSLRNIDKSQIEAELIAKVRDTIGPIAAFKTLHIVSRLPKTRSGKILRKSIRELVDGLDPKTPSTIEDPEAMNEIRRLF